jgi:hypothetical protein
MTESTHHKITSKNDDHPSRSQVERTRDVFRATKAPAIKQQAAEPEAKPVNSRRPPPEYKEKKERKTATEKENKLERERLKEEEQRAKDIAEHEERIGYSNYYYGKCLSLNGNYFHKELTDEIGNICTGQDDEYEYRYVERISMLEMEMGSFFFRTS